MDRQDNEPEDEIEKINNLLNKIEPIIKCGNLGQFKQLIQDIHDIQDKTLLRSCYNIKNINLISLICKHNNSKFLRYLLQQSHILQYLLNDDKSKEIESKQNALYFAMRSNHFEIIEILYDYWSGNLHWLGHIKEYNEVDIENLNQLNLVLIGAIAKYERHIQVKRKVDQLMMFNIRSLLTFNDFQTNIYKELNILKTALISWEDEPKDIIRKEETYAIRSMILAIIDIYITHSNNKKNESLVQNREINNFEDSSDGNSDDFVEWEADIGTIIRNTHFYITHEVYYRKLDSNICLLILDNLHLLKVRLSMAKDSYQKLENKLYHFYYHVSNKWSFYLPKRKKNKELKCLGEYKNTSCKFILNYDVNKWEKLAQLLYLERRDFEKNIHSFKKELTNRNIEENIREEKIKLPIEDLNYLVLVPELRDDYSLKMMSRLIAQLDSIDVNEKYAVLLVERTLQVVGEFLKSANDSLHLEPSTEALLKAETSVEVINDLKTLRNMLAHAKNGMLLKRIDFENNNTNIIKSIRKELLYIKTKVDKVIRIHKPLVHRALLRNTKSILCEIRNEMPQVVATVIIFMINLLQYVPHDINQFFEKMWPPLKYLGSITREACMLLVLFIEMETKLTRVNETIRNNITREFSFYRENIENSLKTIAVCKIKWQNIVKEIRDQNPSINLSDYPNEKDANRINSYSKHTFPEDNSLFACIEHHWKFIGNLLEFIVIKSCIFNDTGMFNDIIEDFATRSSLKELKEYDYMTNDVHVVVIEYLNKIKQRLETINKTNMNFLHQSEAHPPKFSGIMELTKKLMKPNFLTKEEKNYLIDTLQNIRTNTNKQLLNKKNMIENIEKNIAIPQRIYNKFINKIKSNENAQKVLTNFFMGRERDPLIVHCLSNRVSLLKQVTKNQTTSQLVSRYKLDETFRVLVEILLFDIFDIMEGNNKNTVIVKKLSKLLMEINLRNILVHGNPLLDVVGVALDSNDLPTELITKAIVFIEDKTSIDALRALSDSGYFSQEDSNAMTPEQQSWMIEFKTSARWKDYIKLIPDYKKKMYVKRKNTTATVDKPITLLEAVRRKDYLLVQKSIDEGANVNFIDTHKRAAIHYAAMSGDTNIIRVLLINGANINIRNEENNLTALHYAAMKKYKNSVEFLLHNNANCHALDSKGRTPAYLANQRGCLDVAQILLREMRKREEMLI